VGAAWSNVTDRAFSGEVWRNGSMSKELQDLVRNIFGLYLEHLSPCCA